MRGFFHGAERQETNVVRLADFFQRPAHAHVTRQPTAAIGGLLEDGDGDGHRRAPKDCKATRQGGRLAIRRRTTVIADSLTFAASADRRSRRCRGGARKPVPLSTRSGQAEQHVSWLSSIGRNHAQKMGRKLSRLFDLGNRESRTENQVDSAQGLHASLDRPNVRRDFVVRIVPA